jgi:hypothetical protein
MTGLESRSTPNPALHAHSVAVRESFFALFAGPIAWFLQLCVGYGLASEACFRDGTRTVAPVSSLQWTWPAMILITFAAVIVGLLSMLASWRAFSRTRAEATDDSHRLLESGSGRTRFLALWGMMLGGVFALTAAMTFLAFVTLPRCAG